MLAQVEKTDERTYEARLRRLKGELLLMQGDEAEAEANLHSAIEVARRQQAKPWELWATTSLARLRHSQGPQDKVDQARPALRQIHGCFTEEFDTDGLIEAKTLPEELLS